jgi:hypothetical protein
MGCTAITNSKDVMMLADVKCEEEDFDRTLRSSCRDLIYHTHRPSLHVSLEYIPSPDSSSN